MAESVQGQLVLRSSKLDGDEILDATNARIDELRFLRQEQRFIVRELSSWFRRPYDGEPLSAYVNCAIAAARKESA